MQHPHFANHIPSENIYKIYTILMSLLAVISITLLGFDYDKLINISSNPWNLIDKSILIVFSIDYFYRLYEADNKIKFFKENIFDLLAILPFDSIFSLFRITRFFRLLRLFRLFRLSGTIGKLFKNSKKFLNTNGFLWVLILSSVVLTLSSMLYSVSENVSFGEALWWAITTTTTVGYGDVSPHTAIGKFSAVLLMFVGIGIIGTLTSSLTTFFSNNKNEQQLDEILSKLDNLSKENSELKERLSQLVDKQRD